jgi:large subunit ribosomal protein L5
MISLQEQYKKEVRPALKEKFGFKNVMEIPKITQVVLNVGIGRHTKEQSYLENVEKTLQQITGQKSVRTKARKSISSFKVREGQIIGVKVSLRGQRMYDFLEKLIRVSFPRIRDFRGISEKIVDRQGNATIGFKDNTAFPEIQAEDLDNVHGLEVCVSTSAKDKASGIEMFRLLGFPFKKD